MDNLQLLTLSSTSFSDTTLTDSFLSSLGIPSQFLFLGMCVHECVHAHLEFIEPQLSARHRNSLHALFHLILKQPYEVGIFNSHFI